jgi:prepilin-type N-terminal cleavage/methylation domain-containing protein
MQRNKARGFTLVELLVAIFAGTLVMGAAVQLFKNVSDTNQLAVNRVDIQQNARSALAVLSRDLSQASIGIPQSGIALPSGAGSAGAAVFGCSAVQCYFVAPNNAYANNVLPPVAPHEAIGGFGTDAITISYLDATWPVNNIALTALAVDGSSITANTGTFDGAGNAVAAPAGRAYNDPTLGVKVGDVLMSTNVHGTAVATVTGVNGGGVILLAANDPLNLNQPAASAGNIAQLKNPGTNVFPVTSAARINVVTYFIQQQNGPDGLPNTADDVAVLMRQVNAQPAIPIAENVTNLQLTYDIYDASAVPPAAPYSAGLIGSAVANTSLIRKVNVLLTLRSQFAGANGQFPTLTVTTAIAPRDLSFSNRYQ